MQNIYHVLFKIKQKLSYSFKVDTGDMAKLKIDIDTKSYADY